MLNSVNIKEVKTKVGEVMRVHRKTHNLSQQDLADLLDLSRITIQNLEAGKNFTIDTLLKVMNHFDLLQGIYTHFSDQKDEIKNTKSLY